MRDRWIKDLRNQLPELTLTLKLSDEPEAEDDELVIEGTSLAIQLGDRYVSLNESGYETPGDEDTFYVSFLWDGTYSVVSLDLLVKQIKLRLSP